MAAMEHPRVRFFSTRAPWLAALAAAALLSGCQGQGPEAPRSDGPRPSWEVQTLADPGLPRRSEPELARCAAAIGLAPERNQPADPTNFGERQPADAFGRAVPAGPALIVLHETVIDEAQTLALFRTPHPNDNDQVSYHLVINPAGDRLRIVPDANRAYGAGMSAFGDFTVRIRPTSVGSVNNVALHLALVSPADGRGDTPGHSGYTDAQYRSAAAQVLLWQARFGIPLSRLTTHAAVDRSHSRYDPRSFRWDQFMAHYRLAAKACGFTAYDTERATY